MPGCRTGHACIAWAALLAAVACRGRADAAEPADGDLSLRAPSIEEMLSVVEAALGLERDAPSAAAGRAGREAGLRPHEGPPVTLSPASTGRPGEPRSRLDKVLDEFNSLAAKGDYAAAKGLAERAARKGEAGAAGALRAAARLADLLAARRDAMRLAAEAKIGETITLRTAAGRRKGELESVTDGGLTLVAKMLVGREVRGTTRFTVAWRDLTPKEQERLAEGWSAEGADGEVARSALAIFRGDAEAAERTLLRLVQAGEHPLAGHYCSRLDALKAEASEPAACLAWEKLARRAEARELTQPAAKALLKDLEAFEKRYGRTRFAAASADSIGAARARAESALAPLVGLVGHWKFDEGEGDVARDSSGKGNHDSFAKTPCIGEPDVV